MDYDCPASLLFCTFDGHVVVETKWTGIFSRDPDEVDDIWNHDLPFKRVGTHVSKTDPRSDEDFTSSVTPKFAEMVVFT